MGIAITKIVPTKEITIDDLKGKILAVDGYNILYQFLTTIRGPDGSPLTDSHGNVTSHLIGLFSRTANLLSKGVKLVFVFDGKPPELKRAELHRRKEIKQEAEKKLADAERREDVAGMKKYAARTARLTPEMVQQAKDLLDALGVPWLDAPSEGEAQAAALVNQGLAYADVSQDADALLYEAPRIIKNLAITGKRKLPGRMAYQSVEPELITYKEVSAELGLTTEQLRILGILIGTDYNPGGVKGIGPKKGMKLVKEHPPAKLFKEVEWGEHWDLAWQDILKVFEDMPVIEPESITFGKVQAEAIRALLIGRHDFSEARVESSLDKLLASQAHTQKGLGEFF